MIETDDAVLLAKWRDGDKAAGSAFIREHYDGITRFFASKAGSEADDLVQKTFLRCAEGAHRWTGTQPRSFLYGIARYVLFEHIRHQVKGRERDVDFRTSSLFELADGAVTQLSRNTERELMLAAMQRIPLDLQLALELFYWEGFGVTQLALVLDIPTGTVKSRLHRARRLLKEALETIPDAPPTVQHTARNMLTHWIDEAKQALGDDVQTP